MKDYGEPWSNSEGFITNRDGIDIDGTQQADSRAVSCVNSCSGVPDSAFAEPRAMAKAWLAWKIREHQLALGNSFEVNQNEIINKALEMRKDDYSFGELNELIDSFKEEA